MKYDDPRLTQFNPAPMSIYRVAWRRKPKSNNRYPTPACISKYYHPIKDLFFSALMNVARVNDLFSEDGDQMIVRDIGGRDEIVHLPELKRLILENDILFKDHWESQTKIDTAIQHYIDKIK